jgi:dihydrofolate reductase
MGKLIVSAWITLDGVFDADSMQEWFLPFESIERQKYIRDGILAADAILLGRTTYEMLASFWPNQKNDDMGPASKLNSAPKYVISTKLKKAAWNNSAIINQNIVGEIIKLKKQYRGEIQIEGSATLVHSLMKENLVDELRLLVHPIIMGSGKRFFKDGMKTAGMKLLNTQTLDKGVILLCYEATST